MAEQVERDQNTLRVMDFDSMSDDEEENGNKTLSVASSGYVSFPRISRREADDGMNIPLKNNDGQDTVTFSSLDTKGKSSFDPYAAPSSAISQASSTKDYVRNGEDLLIFDPKTILSPVAAPASSTLASKIPAPNSLFDDDDSTAAMSVELPEFRKDPFTEDDSAKTRATSSVIPGAAGYLEMEEEPPRENTYSSDMSAEPIRTDSGLLLTHRKNPAVNHRYHQRRSHNIGNSAFRNAQQDYFEAENGFFHGASNKEYFHRRLGGGAGYASGGGGPGKHSMVIVQARRLMSFVKIWMVIFAVVLLVMTGTFFHSFGHTEAPSSKVSKSTTSSTTSVLMPDTVLDAPEQILLLPLNDISQLTGTRNSHHRLQEYQHIQLQPFHEPSSMFGPRRRLRDLRHKFEEWVLEHKKSYHSEEEKEKRFSIWADNHHRTIAKNERHGPCKLTKQHVFGSNHFKDLAPEEFQAKYLTGYKGLFTDELEAQRLQMPEELLQLRKDSGMVLDPSIHKVEFHESVKHRMLMHNPQAMRSDAMRGSKPNCKWYDISCILRWIWTSTGIQFGTLVGTMEPKYDENAYPNGVDWR